MKELKVQIMMLIFLIVLIYINCFIISLLEKILTNVNPVILIAMICCLIYKILDKEVIWYVAILSGIT